MNRRALIGSLAAAAVVAALPITEHPEVPSPGSDWVLVTIEYRPDFVVDVHFDGKLQRSDDLWFARGWSSDRGIDGSSFRDTWRVWCRRDGLPDLVPYLDLHEHLSGGNCKIIAALQCKSRTAIMADRLPACSSQDRV